jgi:long-subunit acyl-CoA synthetase (AMP-forming)
MPLAHAIHAVNRHGSVGVATPYYQVRIVDVVDRTKVLRPGEVGEFIVKGP